MLLLFFVTINKNSNIYYRFTMNSFASSLIDVFIGLGSNLAMPTSQILSARDAIIAHNDISECAFSSLYHSSPMGPQDQPDYVNAVLCAQTHLTALQLLQFLQDIEHAQGRIRKEQRWGARTLDLDILLYGNETIDLPELIVPHLGITERAFVLYPLNEIAPNINIPSKGHIAELIKRCPLAGLKKLSTHASS
jgi:2-amino-4-hydroxy-6-hydroxymethyldihydropteridine diphosphokinase